MNNIAPWNKGIIYDPVTIKCEICGKIKFIPKYKLKNRPGRFCSPECRNKYFSSIPVNKKCVVCNNIFKDSSGGKRKYCSNKCYWKKLKDLNLSYSNTGKYIYTHDNDGNRIYVHRLKIQNKIGKKLSSSDIVHHINGNRSDNRLSNLKLTVQGKHCKKHFENTNKILNNIKAINIIN